jgi:hypothetical protein
MERAGGPDGLPVFLSLAARKVFYSGERKALTFAENRGMILAQ